MDEKTPEEPDRDVPLGGDEPTPEAPAGDEPTREQPTRQLGGASEQPRRLFRSRSDRVLGGVCGGVAQYFGIDAVIVRVVAVALVFLGGAGALVYLAALLMVPDEHGAAAANSGNLRGRLLTGLAAVLLAIAFLSIFPWGWNNWFLPGVVVPLGVLALLGLGVWWLFPPDRDRERSGSAGEILRRVVLGACLLAACAVLALGAAWAGAVGGGGVVAAVVIAAGLLLAAGAFIAPVRWLILPALALALPLAIVSAAGIEVDNSIGDRQYNPASVTELRDRYELGVGQLVVDLRDTDLPAGEHRLKMKLGVGDAVLVVPEDVCVSSAAQIGVGQVDVFDSGQEGVDVDWVDRHAPPDGRPTIVVDADIGLGAFEVQHDLDDDFHNFHRFDDTGRKQNAAACKVGRSA
ncbi:MAG TPA: PspC domain-containing protein [Thermoleophilaceae bacterium]